MTKCPECVTTRIRDVRAFSSSAADLGARRISRGLARHVATEGPAGSSPSRPREENAPTPRARAGDAFDRFEASPFRLPIRGSRRARVATRVPRSSPRVPHSRKNASFGVSRREAFDASLDATRRAAVSHARRTDAPPPSHPARWSRSRCVRFRPRVASRRDPPARARHPPTPAHRFVFRALASQDKDAKKEDDKKEEEKDWTHAYAEDLRAEIYTEVNADPKAFVHSREWAKIMRGDPVEINPSIGNGLKIMTVDEWSARWKRNGRFPDCLACGATNTKEHHFTQTWCRGKKQFESELLCLDCHMYSWRSYSDPDFMLPEEYDKVRWEKMVQDKAAGRPVDPDPKKV